MNQEMIERAERWYEEGWENQNLDVFKDLLAGEFRLREMFGEKDVQTLRDLEAGARRLWKSCDRLEFPVDEIICADETVAVRYRIKGTHKKTQRDFDIQAMAFIHFEDGEIKDGWNCSDLLGFYSQLRMLDRPRQAREA